MKYFAYGSNMSLQRLQARVPDARFLSIGILAQYRLRFHKAGSDKSAKCDAFYTSRDTDKLFGVVYEMPRVQRPALDFAEGLGHAYDAKQVRVITPDGEHHTALIYIAIGLDSNLLPYDWYLNHVLVGAREVKLPEDYIAEIALIQSTSDPDTVRSEKEFSIHLGQ